MKHEYGRRGFLQGLGAAAATFWLSPAKTLLGSIAPAAPVSVAKCNTYGPEVLARLSTMFDQLGGLERIVRGRTVAIKLNMTGGPENRVHGLPLEQTHWVHPQVIGATVHLLGKAGAKRVRLLESAPTADSLERFMARGNWNPTDFASAAAVVEFENTNDLGNGKSYVRMPVPGGGMMFSGFDLNHSYRDCDVFVSLAKLKEHATAGVTLSMKNLFGLPPCTIYGDGAGLDEPSKLPKGFRGMLHEGNREPSRSAPSENDPHSPRDPGYRVPRITADLVAARPIHLAIIDGIQTMAGGEGPWVQGTRPVRPGLLVAGTNCVTTDSVAAALMGFDPMAERGTAPFEKCASTLRLGEQLGIGTRDLSQIEVLGTPVSKARFDFRTAGV